MTRCAREAIGRRLSALALVVSLLLAAQTDPGTAAASPGLAFSTTSRTQPDTGSSGAAGRIVVRVGALIFAVGGIATYVAAGSRRRPDRRPAPSSTSCDEIDDE